MDGGICHELLEGQVLTTIYVVFAAHWKDFFKLMPGQLHSRPLGGDSYNSSMWLSEDNSKNTFKDHSYPLL